MLTFKYKVFTGKKTKKKYIEWTCLWDGRHDNEIWDTSFWQVHPFSSTFDYQDDLKQYEMLMERFRRHKKKEIYLRKPHHKNKKRMAANEKKGVIDWRDCDWPETKKSKADIEKMHPDHMREVGDIVAYNPATLGLCKVLSDKKNLKKHSGNTAEYCYFTKLLGSLYNLWD